MKPSLVFSIEAQFPSNHVPLCASSGQERSSESRARRPLVAVPVGSRCRCGIAFDRAVNLVTGHGAVYSDSSHIATDIEDSGRQARILPLGQSLAGGMMDRRGRSVAP